MRVNAVILKSTVCFGVASIMMGASGAESALPKTAPANKPNVLFIISDDMKPLLGCYGDKLAKTPNIDRLAQEGIVFLSNYCQQAICGPSRVSLLTGYYPDASGVTWLFKEFRRPSANPDVVTLPQLFRENGYQTISLGKVFGDINEREKISWTQRGYKSNRVQGCWGVENNDPERKRKQDEITKQIIKDGGSEKRARSAWVKAGLAFSTESADVADSKYSDGSMTEDAIEILQSMAKKHKPFFLAVGYLKPHLPFYAPKKYWDMYKRSEMPIQAWQKMSRNGTLIAHHTSKELRFYTDIPKPQKLKMIANDIPIDKQRELIHGYYASVSYIDAQVGKLVHELKRLDLDKNTIIVLWGDHGWHLGDHGLWCKQSNFEQATHSPLIIVAPGYKGGLKTDSLTGFIDVYPTLCDLAQLKKPSHLQGISLIPLMKDPKKELRKYIVSQYPRSNGMGYSIRTDCYRYTLWTKNKFNTKKEFSPECILVEELYDYKNDPKETQNLAGDPKYKTIRDEHYKLLLEFFDRSYKQNKEREKLKERLITYMEIKVIKKRDTLKSTIYLDAASVILRGGRD